MAASSSSLSSFSEQSSTIKNNNNNNTTLSSHDSTYYDCKVLVDSLMDLHDILSSENQQVNNWEEDCEQNIYNDLKYLDASPLFTTLINFLIDKDNDKHFTTSKENSSINIDNNNSINSNNDIQSSNKQKSVENTDDDINLLKLLGLSGDDDYAIKTLIVGIMLKENKNKENLIKQIVAGNKYAKQFATIINVVYRFLKLTKIIFIQYWSVTSIEDLFKKRILSEEENEEREAARLRAIEKINAIINDSTLTTLITNDNKLDKKEKHGQTTSPLLRTIIVEKIYPFLLSLKSTEC
uniref:Uncharacterized protein n=1 Tax=Metapenaeus joyneri majanivirus TaxID=2984280 RepID=A0A9C7F0L3_9VIRU|nr:MAG: hypothetical protein [Metapenaeus joyneri majanivirus]